MIWLTWRQQRLETFIGGGVLALVVVFLIATGLEMASAYQSMGVSTCLAHDASPAACQNLANDFQSRFSAVIGVITWLNFLPLVFGVLLAAPFVLELEQGTFRLAWTQSVTRRRWLAVKLSVIMAAAIGVSVAFTILTTWWNGPLDHLGSRLNPNQFDFEGVVPIAYTVFVMALCLAAGSVLRRTIPAIGIALGGYIGLRVLLETWVRYDHYLVPVTKHVSMASGGPAGPGAPSRADYLIGAFSSLPRGAMQICLGATMQPPPPGTAAAGRLQACLGHHGAVASVIYQPANRFWLFQGIESAIYLGLAAILLTVTVWWIRDRVA